MPWLTGLADVARRTGYPVVERAGWKTRGRAAMSGTRSVMCHHTAGGKNGNAPSLGVVQNGRPGLPGPLAHFVLGRDGTIYVVAAGRANHAGKVSATKYTNSYSIGIEAENTGTGEPWGDRQMDAYAKLCRELCDHYGIPINDVVGHREAAVPRGRKIDPTFNMNDFRSMVRARKGTGASGGSGGSTYKTVNKTAPLGLYDKDAKDHTRIADWQRDALGYTGKKVDGYFGPDTDRDTRALQRKLGVKDDGLVGDDTLSAWKSGGKKTPAKPTPKPSGKVPGPGYDFPLPAGAYFGPKSGPNRSYSGFHNRSVGGKTDRQWIKEWATQLGRRGWSVGKGETWLNRSGNDGKYGSEYAALIKAFQKDRGIAQDSLLGKNTWDAAFKNPVT